MKISAFFILLLIGALFAACHEDDPYVYTGKVDSASIGLVKRTDTLRKIDMSRPQMPMGLIIDTGINNPFGEDTLYIMHKKKPENNDPTFLNN